MKFGVISLSGLVFLSYLCFGQNYSHITDLRGIEDSSGHTQLFYRYVNPSSTCWSKSIFHLDVFNHIDTLFIYDAASDPIGEGCRGDFVYDYEFFHNNISEFIYGGYDFFYDPVPILRRYDGDVQLPLAGFGGVTEIEISAANNNLVYATINQSALYRSTDGGYNFEINLDSLPLIDNAIISLSKNNDSQIYGIDDNKLVRSEDQGYSYTIVDNSFWDDNSDLFYDADASHIYGLSNYYDFSTQSYNSNIFVSNDNGNPFTWSSIIFKNTLLKFTIDEIHSGEIYYSEGRQIFKSTDFGTTFNHYRTVDRKVTGLYKKSGTNILYASTPLKIYEITPTDIQVIKELPIPQEVLNYYPLQIGNKWVYNIYGWSADTTIHNYSGITVREVLKDTVISNGYKYFKLSDPTTFNYPATLFERIDSTSGKVFRYDNTLGLPDDEYLIEDLLAEVGDTIWSSRHQYQDYFPFVCVYMEIFNKWGIQSYRKIFNISDLTGYTYSLAQDIGLDSIYDSFDFGENFAVLKGCIIDGEVYGDTTVVSVEDANPKPPTEFSLSQNYPNPFNPVTRIQYTVGSQQIVTLKIYDLLGREISTLVNEEKPAGNYEVEFDVGTSRDLSLSSGIYFYQLKAGSFIQTKKMILLK